MTLPTVWQLLLPNISIGTVIGFLLIAVGIFKGVILTIIGKVLAWLSKGNVTVTSLRISLIGSGVVMVWLPSILSDLMQTIEGKLLLGAIVLAIIFIMIIVSSVQNKATGNEGGDFL